MTVAIIVQARMGSKRFPGKIVAPFMPFKPGQGKRCVLEHVLLGCKMASKAGRVVLATPSSEDHRAAWNIADRYGIGVYPGHTGLADENDVLDRYYEASGEFGITHGDHIVRITADCPLINARVIDEVIELHLKQDADYTSNVLPRSYPKGLDVEVMTFDALEAAWLVAHSHENGDSSNVPESVLYMREHVTPWLQTDPDIKRANLHQGIDQSEINLCVDYPGDPERIVTLLNVLKSRMPKLWMPEKRGSIH